MKVYIIFAKGWNSPLVNNFTGRVYADKQEALKWLPEYDVVMAETDGSGDYEYLEENEE
tara:strand:+ start:107 stop:283 length:177 start_codon:yes stop_codon:yes gene_type:complete